MIVAIDPALRASGVAVLDEEDGSLQLQGAWVVVQPEGKGGKTWAQIASRILAGVRMFGEPTTIVVEEMRAYPHRQVNPNDLLQVNGVAGAVVGALSTAYPRARVLTCYPTDWKKSGADKESTKRLVDKRVDSRRIRSSSPGLANNAYDAVGIGLWAEGQTV